MAPVDIDGPRRRTRHWMAPVSMQMNISAWRKADGTVHIVVSRLGLGKDSERRAAALHLAIFARLFLCDLGGSWP